MPRIGKSVKTESRLVVVRGLEGCLREWGVTTYENRASLWG
jgi:hypothetical protein